jgi:hypothetical protein
VRDKFRAQLADVLGEEHANTIANANEDEDNEDNDDDDDDDDSEAPSSSTPSTGGTPAAWAYSSVSTFGTRYAPPVADLTTPQSVEALVEGSAMSQLREGALAGFFFIFEC